DEARRQARGILEGLQREGRYSWLRALTGEGVLALMRAIPYGSLLLNSEAISNAIRDAAGEGVTIGAEQITQVWTRLHERLGSQLGDYVHAPWRLGKAIGQDLANFAR